MSPEKNVGILLERTKKTNSSPPRKYNNMKSAEGYLYTTIVIRQIAKKKKKMVRTTVFSPIVKECNVFVH